jgi:hypothetical protein
MLVPEVFKDHLTLEVRPVIHAMNTDLLNIPEGITSYSSEYTS